MKENRQTLLIDDTNERYRKIIDVDGGILLDGIDMDTDIEIGICKFDYGVYRIKLEPYDEMTFALDYNRYITLTRVRSKISYTLGRSDGWEGRAMIYSVIVN